MTRRRSFLFGTLAGVVLGVSVSTMITWLAKPAQPELQPLQAIPIVISPTSQKPIPEPRGEKRFFNGQPYYIIPLT